MLSPIDIQLFRMYVNNKKVKKETLSKPWPIWGISYRHSEVIRSECYFILALYSLRLLLTTEILLKAMARAARMGCSCRSMSGRDSKG